MTPGELDRLAAIQAEIRDLFAQASRRVNAWDLDVGAPTLTGDEIAAARCSHPATGNDSC